MKNLLIALALALPVAAHAAPAVAPVLGSPLGSRVNDAQAQNLLFIGAPVYRIETNVSVDSPVLLLTGAGMLYGIHCGSGTNAGYELTYDSASTGGITVASLGIALHAPLYSPGSAAAAANVGLLDFNTAPVAFTHGLVALVHGSTMNCYIRARLNTGANPGP